MVINTKRRAKPLNKAPNDTLLVASSFILGSSLVWLFSATLGIGLVVSRADGATQKATTSAPKYEPPKDIAFVPLTKEFIDMVNDGSRYNKYATPTQYNGIATNVSISMYIEGISNFRAQTMDYHLDILLYQEWRDKRLQHNGTGPMLIRDKLVFKQLWHPDIYFANARSASFQDITEDNFLVWVYPDGRVWYDCRISLVAICMMNLWKYPLDSQECSLRILSYAYPESQLHLRWSEEIDPPIDRNPEIIMPDMRLVDIRTGNCNGTYVTGTWSCMTAVFYVQREMMHHIIQTYVPTALIVVISWFNFWLDIDSAPARVSLSITTLLTIATQANAVKLALPEVSYMKAIDFWLGMCMTFVFGVMVEYTIAHYAKNQEIHRSGPPNLLVDSTLSTLFGAGSTHTTNSANMGTEGAVPRHFQKHRKSSPGAMLNHSQSAYEQNAAYQRPLRADEPDQHMIRVPPAMETQLDWIHQEDALDEDEELASGYGEESEFHTIFTDNHLHFSRDNGGMVQFAPHNHLLNHNNNGSNSIPAVTTAHPNLPNVLKHNSFTTNAAEARLRIPSELRGDGEVGGVEKLNLDASPLKRRKASMCRIKHQVARRAQSMKSNVQAQCNLRGRAMAINIDQKSRILFPLCFILMNIGYWGFYLILN